MNKLRKLTANRKNKIIKAVIFLSAFTAWISWDLSQANGNFNYVYKSFVMSSELNNSTNATATVAIVRSNDNSLANPVPIDDANISDTTIEQMVWRAIELAGGFPDIKSGMTVLIKPNLVESQVPNGCGNDTDVRVVEAVVKYVDNIDHGKIKILVGDGSPRPFTTFEHSVSGAKQWNQLYGDPDPNKDAGYQKLKDRMVEAGVDFRITNLNGNSDTDPWSELVEVKLPNGQALPQNSDYYIHQDVVNADVYIAVPVMKIHDTGLTCALKDQIGLAPSTLYGFSKTAGVNKTGSLQSSARQHRLLHVEQAPLMWTDKEIVDLSTIAKIKYAVVDAIMCLETQKTIKSDYSNQVRMNTVVAGSDPVAVDHVCAEIMGLNPDDVEHITLAARVGLGTNNSDNINVVGSSIEITKRRFKKNQAYQAVFGQSNRDWLVSNVFSTSGIDDPINYDFIANESSMAPTAGNDGWSQDVYFINDRIDLKNYFAYKLIGTTNTVSYAFTYFTSPDDQPAELWIGSDEAMKIYLNGENVYTFNTTRSFSSSSMFTNKVQINIKKGYNKLLVKTLQKNGTYDFSLNICEVESNPDYWGNRINGLKFTTDPNPTSVKEISSEITPEFMLSNCYPNPFNSQIQIPFVVRQDENVTLSIYNMLGQRIRTIFNGRTGTNSYRILSWDGQDENGKVVASGSYIVVLQNGNHKFSTKKIVLLK